MPAAISVATESTVVMFAGPLGQDRNHCLPTASCAQEEVLMLLTNWKSPLSQQLQTPFTFPAHSILCWSAVWPIRRGAP